MVMNQHKNPMYEDLQEIETLWEDFLESEKFYMIWDADLSSMKVVSGYFQYRNESVDWATDLILTAEIQDGKSLAKEISQAIITQYESLKESDAGEEFLWNAPESTKGEDHDIYLVKVLKSFLSYHHDLFQILAIYLNPLKQDIELDHIWLENFLAQHKVKGVVFIFVDSNGKWDDNSLKQSVKSQVDRKSYFFDEKTAMRKTASAARDGKPDMELRFHFVEMMAATPKNPEQFSFHKQKAQEVIETQNWEEQAPVLHLLAAAAYFSCHSKEMALQEYHTASEKAGILVENGNKLGSKQQLQASMGIASVFVGDQQWLEAAEEYEKAAQFGEAAEEEYLLYESRRMAAFCYDRAMGQDLKLSEKSWEFCLKGLESFEKFNTELKEHVPLEYLARTMIKQSQWQKDRKSVDKVHERAVLLMGEKSYSKIAKEEGVSI